MLPPARLPHVSPSARRRHRRTGGTSRVVQAVAIMAGLVLGPVPGLIPGAGPAHAQSTEDVYTVRDVAVDVTADNSALARDRAVEQAQRRALERLFARITPAAAASAPPRLEAAELDRLVDALEVQEERTSAVRYLGTITVRFRPATVRSLLLANGLGYAEVPSKPVLVIPVDVTAGRPVLWQQETAWRQAWDQAPATDGLVPVLLPLGDLDDVTGLSLDQALGNDRVALQALADRYGAGAVAIVQAGLDGELAVPRFDDPATLAADTAPVPVDDVPPPAPWDTATAAPADAVPDPAEPPRPRGLMAVTVLHRFIETAPESVPQVFVVELPPDPAATAGDSALDSALGGPGADPAGALAPADPGIGSGPSLPGEPPPVAGPPPGVADLMPMAVTRTVAAIEQDWIAVNLVEAGQQGLLTVEVPLTGMQDWLETRNRLDRVPTVVRSRLVSLTRARAELDLAYLGDTDRLRTALAQQDLLLSPPSLAPSLATERIGAGTAAAAPVWQLVWRGSVAARPTTAMPVPLPAEPAPEPALPGSAMSGAAVPGAAVPGSAPAPRNP